ncbi:MAG: aldehyde dehydrogenase family protein, partial [Acidimicrobiales bacterium]
ALEMGAPLGFMRLSGRATLASLEHFSQTAVSYPSVEERDGPWRSLVCHEPVGVVATISPWNGPFAMSVGKSATAMLAGCVVVDKPSAETPFDAMPWAEALSEAGLPSGVYNLIPGGTAAGAHLVQHPLVDMVSFTGGTVAGRKIGAVAGQHLKRVVLELGGKSAAIVLDDADLDTVVTSVGASLFPNCGQVCSGLTRVIVPSHLVDDVLARLVEYSDQIVVGDPLASGTIMGPLASLRQYERVRSFIDSGRAEGAVLASGGGRPEHLDVGYYLAPTIFTQVTNEMTIGREEIFGPVVSVIAHDGDEDALRKANDSAYGLNGAVFSGDHERATALARGLWAGSVTINAYTSNFEAPRTGLNDSGLGARGGIEGFNEHRISRTINLEPGEGAYTPGNLIGTASDVPER